MISANEAREQISLLTARIDRLQHILSNNIHNVSIHLFTETTYYPKQYQVLNNDDIPFSLEGELRLLIADSIEELERQRQSFESYL